MPFTVMAIAPPFLVGLDPHAWSLPPASRAEQRLDASESRTPRFKLPVVARGSVPSRHGRTRPVTRHAPTRASMSTSGNACPGRAALRRVLRIASTRRSLRGASMPAAYRRRASASSAAQPRGVGDGDAPESLLAREHPRRRRPSAAAAPRSRPLFVGQGPAQHALRVALRMAARSARSRQARTRVRRSDTGATRRSAWLGSTGGVPRNAYRG